MNNLLNAIEVSVGILFNEHNQILIAKRPLHKPYGGLWEFPGGKIEPNESPTIALKRELLEELNIALPHSQESNVPFHQVNYVYPDNDNDNINIRLIIFKITHFIGKPIGAEGQQIKWVNQSDLTAYDFPAPNQDIINLLQMAQQVKSN